MRCAPGGVGGIFLPLITDREEPLAARFRRIESMRAGAPEIARMVRGGYHLEGLWLRPEPGYCGAYPPELMKAPAIPAFERLQASASGNIRLVTARRLWSEAPAGAFVAS